MKMLREILEKTKGKEKLKSGHLPKEPSHCAVAYIKLRDEVQGFLKSIDMVAKYLYVWEMKSLADAMEEKLNRMIKNLEEKCLIDAGEVRAYLDDALFEIDEAINAVKRKEYDQAREHLRKSGVSVSFVDFEARRVLARPCEK